MLAKSPFLLLLGLSLLPVGASADPGVFRGPYLADVTTDSVTVLWESPAPTTGTVHYGVSSPNEMSAASSAPAIHHEVVLTGLAAMATPGTRFVFELEVGTQRLPGEFHTAVDGTTPFQFVVYGDNRSSEVQHTAVVDAIMQEMADTRFLLSTGDLVSDGSNESNWDTFFTIEAPLLSRLPLFVAIGNHEVDGGDWNVGQRILRHPTSVAPASNDESFYHFVYGNAEMIMLNVETHTLYTGLLSFLAGDQEAWLEQILANPPPGVDHRFIFIHQGPYSSKPGRTGNSWFRRWLSDFKAAGIDLVISGHDHYAERGWSSVGIPYVIHGGGGAPLYDTYGPRVTSDHTITYGESRLGYVLVTVNGQRVDVQLKGLAGEIVESFSYGDPTDMNACTNASDCGAAPPYGCLGGAWECVRSACRYTCPEDASLIACNPLNDNCDTELSGQCSGQASCETPSIDPRSWYCACDVPPECTVGSDCDNNPPPIPGCQGTWGCPDGVCEFTPTTVCSAIPPADAGASDGPSLDVGPQDAESPDTNGNVMDAGGASSTDAAPLVDAGPQIEDTGVMSADPDASGQPAPEGSESDGCQCRGLAVRGGAGDAGWFFVLLIVSSAWSGRFRRGRRRAS